MGNVCEFAALMMARHFKSQISNYKMTTDFSELKTLDPDCMEARPIHAEIGISRGKRIGNLHLSLTAMKELTAL